MSIVYGFGLTGLFPSDLLFETQLSFLEEFAQLELTDKFVEIIQDKSQKNQNLYKNIIAEITGDGKSKLIESTDNKTKTILMQWERGFGSISYGYASSMLNCVDIFIPNLKKNGTHTIELSCMDRELIVAGYNYGIDTLQEMREDLNEEKKEYCDQLLALFKIGQENNFLFSISD